MTTVMSAADNSNDEPPFGAPRADPQEPMLSNGSSEKQPQEEVSAAGDRRLHRTPDPTQYVRLWDRNGKKRSTSNGTTTAAASTTPCAALEDELDVALHNTRIWERIDECQRTIVRCEAEIQELRRELDRLTVLPRLLVCDNNEGDSDNDTENSHRRNGGRNARMPVQQFWDEEVALELKYDRDAAWTLVRTVAAAPPLIGTSPVQGYDIFATLSEMLQRQRLPLPFQKMLWTDERCPLRNDRDLLLASLDFEGGLHDSIRVPWSGLLENDRDILVKMFERSPWSLDFADVPPRFLEDKELFLTFIRSKWLKEYRNKRLEGSAIVYRFSENLLNDPDLLAELVSKTDSWSRYTTRCSGITDAQHPFLDNREFVLLATKWMGLENSYCRDTSPVRYERLSQRIKACRDVILAFASLDSEFWAGKPTSRWTSGPVDAGTAALDSQELLHPAFPEDGTTDREKAARLVFLRSMTMEITGDWSIVQRVQEDREFWIQMAETHLCPVSGWELIPKHIASDLEVIMAWARNATRMTCDWIVWADDQVKILSDRQALLNCLPQMWKFITKHRLVWDRVDPRAVDSPLLVDVLSRTDANRVVSIYEFLPNALSTDRAAIDSLLRCGTKGGRTFPRLFCCLPFETQLQFADVLVEALRSGSGTKIVHDCQGLNMRVFHLPEVVDAALSRGWCPSDHRNIDDIVNSAPWSTDETFLLSLARRYSDEVVSTLFSENARRNENLMRAATRLNAGLLWSLSENLRYDFDMLFGALSGLDDGGGGVNVFLRDLGRSSWGRNAKPCAVHTGRLRAFAREVRRRLGLHASLCALMGGIRRGVASSSSSYDAAAASVSSSPTSPSVSVLNQGPDAVDALEGRLAGFLGAPTDPSDVAEYRRVSNALSRYGY